MLRALLKREIEIEPLDEPAARRPHLAPVSTNLSPNRRRKPRFKAVPIVLLYPEAEPEPQSQVETLLCELQTHAQDAIGQYVPQITP